MTKNIDNSNNSKANKTVNRVGAERIMSLMPKSAEVAEEMAKKIEDCGLLPFDDKQLDDYMSDGVVSSPVIDSLDEVFEPEVAKAISDAKEKARREAVESRIAANKDGDAEWQKNKVAITASIIGEPNPAVGTVDPIAFANWQKKLSGVTDDLVNNLPHVVAAGKNTDVPQDAKFFFTENKRLVQKQCEDVVALYSVKQQKPFYFITPAEARIAIEYIKNQRNNTRTSEERDARLHELAEISASIIFPKINALTEEEKQAASFQSSIKFQHNKSLFHYIGKSKDPFRGDCMSLNGINNMFCKVEQHGLTVTSIFMHAFRLRDIRNFGRTVYDESTKSELQGCPFLFGRLFTANMYRYNDIMPTSLFFVANSFVDSSDEKAHISYVLEIELIDTPDLDRPFNNH